MSGRAMFQMNRALLKEIFCQGETAISRRHLSKWADSKDVIKPDDIRKLFSKSMSEMYRQEVPQYSTLLELVRSVNEDTLRKTGKLDEMSAVDVDRLSEERHGAIRLGTPEELYNIRRLFAVMGMHPVGYYDLSAAGVPVHSTAFRSLDDYSLNQSPFRVFTSLLRLELLNDKELREKSLSILHRRKIFSPSLLELIEKFETDKVFQTKDANSFIAEAIKVFKFNNEITVSVDVYKSLLSAHSLVADIVCFKTPHINHLTPSTLDIDRVQESMSAEISRTNSDLSRKGSIVPKTVIEGPPRRDVPILLRQTSFKALSEDIVTEGTSSAAATHTARFGEVEQRGLALTTKGRQLYDYLLDKTRGSFQGIPNESNSKLYMENLEENFSVFPDDLNTLRKEKLAFFKYFVTEKGKNHLDKNINDFNLENYIRSGLIGCEGIRYEDFLPVSAAGIFQSNLAGVGQNRPESGQGSGSRGDFENALGCPVHDEMKLYADRETKTLQNATFYFIR